MIRIRIPGDPPTKTAQEKGLTTRTVYYNGRPRVVPFAYETPEVKQIRHRWRLVLMDHKPLEPIKGPVRMTTVWTFKTAGRHKPGTYKDTKPDTDNLIKLLKDALADCGYFENDSRVADERTIKVWGDDPGIEITLESIKGGFIQDGTTES